jgi:hypothetical protein
MPSDETFQLAMNVTSARINADFGDINDLPYKLANTLANVAKNIGANYETRPNTLWYDNRQWIAYTLTKQDDFSKTLLGVGFNDRETGQYPCRWQGADVHRSLFGQPRHGKFAGRRGSKYEDTYRDSNGAATTPTR